MTILKDACGYAVERVRAEPTEGVVLGRRNGVYIVGRGGRREFRTYDIGQGLQLWKKIIAIDSPDVLVAFMNKWGPVTRSDLSWPFDEPYRLLEPVLEGLRHLAGRVDALDRAGFFQIISRVGVHQVQPDEKGIWHPSVKTLAQFAVVEMALTFGGERPASLGLQTCLGCGRPFPVGARRRRRDARYCEDKCRKASHARKKTATRNTV